MARILVVGGSLGGLMAAGALLRDGHDVQVLERSTRSLEGRGAGIVTHDNLRMALNAAGAVVDDTLGVPVQSRVVLAADGSTERRWDYPQVLTSWGRLYALLRAAVSGLAYRLDATVTAVTQTEQQVTATLTSGETLQADLLIAADGLRSGVRARLAPAVQPAYVGYIAWRGVCDEAVLSQRTRSTLFGHFGFGLPDGEQMISYPVAGANDSTATGERRCNFVWYRPVSAGADLAALMTDADGRHHPEGIAPQAVSWRCIAAMRQAARERLAPQYAEVVEKTAMPFLQPIYDLVSQRLAFGRMALLGDAAFVARPHTGMGVTKAGDDARALAAAVAAHGATPKALQHYEQERLPVGTFMVNRGRALGGYLEAHQRDHAARRDPDDVMRQTAIEARDFAPVPPLPPITQAV